MRLRWLAPLLLAGCVNNSGGEPPPGDPVGGFELILDSLACVEAGNRGEFIETVADANAWVQPCVDGPQRNTVQERLISEVADLSGTAGLVAIDVPLTGCEQGLELVDLYLDGTTLRPWLLKRDTAWGREGNECGITGSAQTYFLMQGADRVDTIGLWIGRYNPDFGTPLVVE